MKLKMALKKEKENLKIKVFLKVVKFIFRNLPKIVHFYLNKKNVFQIMFKFDWVCNWDLK